MGDYRGVVDEMLDFSKPAPEDEPQAETGGAASRIDYGKLVDDMLMGKPEVVDQYRETDEIDTRTAKPRLAYTGEVPPATDFATMIWSGFVDDPKAKIAVYAEGRFPEEDKKTRESRYRVVDGRIVYRGDDGRYYPEISKFSPLQYLKRFAGENVANLPAGLGAAATISNPVTAPYAPIVAGAAEGMRQYIGEKISGVENSSTENLLRMTAEVMFTKAGDITARGLGALRNARRVKKGQGLEYAVANDLKMGLIGEDDHARAALLAALAEKHGIELAPHQLYNKEGITNFWKYLRKHPATADAVRKYEDGLGLRVERATENVIRSTGAEEDVALTGQRLSDAAQDIVAGAKKTRTRAVRPMYQKAAAEAGPIDTTPVIEKIDLLLAEAPDGSAGKKALERIRRMLYRKQPNAETGKPELVQEDRLPLLDSVKKEIDTIVGAPATDWKTAIEKETKVKLVQLRDELVGVLDAASPEYAKARRVYQRLVPNVERIERGPIGRIARMTDEKQMSRAVTELLGEANTTPMMVRRARGMISHGNPQLWDDAVAAHIRTVYEGLKATEEGSVVNVAGKLYKRLFGSEKQRKILRAAMAPEQFKNFEGFMKVLRAAAIGTGKESMTMPFARIDEQLSRVAGGKVARMGVALTQPVVTAREMVFERWNDLILAGNQRQLLDALTDSNAARVIARMRKMSPGSNQQLRALGAFLGTMVADKTSDTSDRLFWSDSSDAGAVRPKVER